MVYMSLFFSLAFNYLYHFYLQHILIWFCDSFIVICDTIGLEAHYLRFLHLAIFDSRMKPLQLDLEILLDHIYLILIITPLFIIGMRFWTAPVYLNYCRQINAVVAPLGLPVIFYATHIDISLLALLVTFMNAYAFWYHADPPSSVYDSYNYRNRYIRQQ